MFSIYNCGYDSKHLSALDMRRPNGSPDYTLLFIKTEAFFEVEGKIINTPANTAILYDKFAPVHYGCLSPHYNDDWIHFDIEEQDLPFLLSLDIPFNKPHPLAYVGHLSEYARLIVLEKHSDNPYKEEILDSLMRTLLYSLASQLHSIPDAATSNKNYQAMNELRMAILNAPHRKWTIREMSRMVLMSPSYFQHLYKELFGVSCMQDVIAARLKNACFYLRTTDMSIQSLAEFCGYDSELHFMRQFKKYQAMTPSQYREHYRRH